MGMYEFCPSSQSAEAPPIIAFPRWTVTFRITCHLLSPSIQTSIKHQTLFVINHRIDHKRPLGIVKSVQVHFKFQGIEVLEKLDQLMTPSAAQFEVPWCRPTLICLQSFLSESSDIFVNIRLQNIARQSEFVWQRCRDLWNKSWKEAVEPCCVSADALWRASPQSPWWEAAASGPLEGHLG